MNKKSFLIELKAYKGGIQPEIIQHYASCYCKVDHIDFYNVANKKEKLSTYELKNLFNKSIGK